MRAPPLVTSKPTSPPPGEQCDQDGLDRRCRHRARFRSQLERQAEYLFVDLGNGSCTAACAIVNPNGPPLIPDVSVRFDESLVRAGIDYRFHS